MAVVLPSPSDASAQANPLDDPQTGFPEIDPDEPGVIAAVDLGSNSFHMLVARVGQGEISIVDRIREMVRLGAGLDDQGFLTDEAVETAIRCLERFRERLRAIQANRVRAVGTNTLRKARNRQAFLAQARNALGHPIEVVSGVEEARLVYQGAAQSLPRLDGSRLVVDIGGGSTEVIIGREQQIAQLESLYMGCVAISNRFFPDARVTASRFSRARLFARRELQPAAGRFRDEGWDEAVGTSGTIRATARMLTGSDNPGGIITREGLDILSARIIKNGDIITHRPDGLGERRAPVYPGGLAILMGVFDALDIQSMTASDGALREGLLYDLVGRLTDEDVRERSTRAMQQRFHCDLQQAARTSRTALGFLAQVAAVWQLEDKRSRQLLKWAADLHEIGLDIAHAHHNRHGAYLLLNADLAGFSTDEQMMLGAIVGNHRRKFRDIAAADASTHQKQLVLRLTVLLRLAVLLHRSRVEKPLPAIRLRAQENGLSLSFASGWLEEHPLAQADLKQERDYLAAMNFDLEWS